MELAGGQNRDRAAAGGVTLNQHFCAAANPNIHLHALVLDGVFENRMPDTPPASL